MENIELINYIKTPVSIVYNALVSEEGLSNTWTKKLKVKPEVGFVNEFDFDEDYLTQMKILELKENQRIVWECIASDDEWVGTRIIFDLSEEKGVTKIILRHADWRELTDFYRWCNYNWAMFLFSLKTYCEKKKGLPFQEREF
ncbi:MULTISPECIES: SRPBCC family protein [Galbibacter]|uniref:SRPBCC domain-containing protein n=1 Tax=Galbibacter pacificus TaxID=2996052 RepID=A0ABT6FQ49_9FLAO|nr:SRPBCC domain-containing protein [Galbibacter pacificus]MDG3582135.1 SRPBCC domain-containing protein [Galbibacter pacificus]MDG3585389.1 SRPBCC domain-containing protein [Galbibacter pacificus]